MRSRYAGSITKFVATREPSAMEQALGHQKSFWRLVGIVAIVYLLIVGLMIVFGLILGGFALMS